jgi:hypothetical protein
MQNSPTCTVEQNTADHCAGDMQMNEDARCRASWLRSARLACILASAVFTAVITSCSDSAPGPIGQSPVVDPASNSSGIAIPDQQVTEPAAPNDPNGAATAESTPAPQEPQAFDTSSNAGQTSGPPGNDQPGAPPGNDTPPDAPPPPALGAITMPAQIDGAGSPVQSVVQDLDAELVTACGGGTLCVSVRIDPAPTSGEGLSQCVFVSVTPGASEPVNRGGTVTVHDSCPDTATPAPTTTDTPTAVPPITDTTTTVPTTHSNPTGNSTDTATSPPTQAGPSTKHHRKSNGGAATSGS